MGYVDDDKFTQWITPFQMFGTVAAWGVVAGQVSGSLVYKCDATDEAAHLHIPIAIPSNSGVSAVTGSAVKGAKLKSVEMDFEILIAACDALSAVFVKNKRGIDGSVVVVSNPAFTYDTGHDTAAERLDVDQHKMTMTLDTPVFIENDEYWYVDVTIDKAATSTFEILGAFVNYTFKA